jgi:hypothetical protein
MLRKVLVPKQAAAIVCALTGLLLMTGLVWHCMAPTVAWAGFTPTPERPPSTPPPPSLPTESPDKDRDSDSLPSKLPVPPPLPTPGATPPPPAYLPETGGGAAPHPTGLLALALLPLIFLLRYKR